MRCFTVRDSCMQKRISWELPVVSVCDMRSTSNIQLYLLSDLLQILPIQQGWFIMGYIPIVIHHFDSILKSDIKFCLNFWLSRILSEAFVLSFPCAIIVALASCIATALELCSCSVDIMHGHTLL